jgi:DnaJ family protein A protein 2
MGVPNNTPITIPGEGNEIPDALAGDLVLITQEQEHKIFTRKGADLFMKKNVSLLEALTGFEFSLTHLDGHEYTIYMKKGDIISDRSKKVVRGLGMPYYKNNLSHGNLIIEFHVVMPKRGTLTAEQYK